MKVLILSTGTGEGHNSAAKAMKEQFDKNGIPCVMADALDFASEKAAGYGRKIYIWSTEKGVFGGAYKVGKAISSTRGNYTIILRRMDSIRLFYRICFLRKL